MGSPGADEKAIGQSLRHFSSSQHPSPWPWPPPRRPPSQAPTLTLRPTLGMDTMATGHTGEDITDTAMATMERDLLMMPLPLLAPTLMPLLIPGMDTTAMATDHTAMATTGTVTDTATTTARDPLMPSPLPSPLPALRPRPAPVTDTTAMVTGHTAMVTMATGPTGTLTGVK